MQKNKKKVKIKCPCLLLDQFFCLQQRDSHPFEVSAITSSLSSSHNTLGSPGVKNGRCPMKKVTVKTFYVLFQNLQPEPQPSLLRLLPRKWVWSCRDVVVTFRTWHFNAKGKKHFNVQCHAIRQRHSRQSQHLHPKLTNWHSKLTMEQRKKYVLIPAEALERVFQATHSHKWQRQSCF